jgi:diguanylate cyclase (GGDEF)-like protein/PAS domain S-box-containing protein
MDKKVPSPDDQDKTALRLAAERKAKAYLEDLQQLDKADRDQLLQELQIHQIELELQNEELREAHFQLEYTHRQYLDLYNEAPVGYASLDANGMILRCNQTLLELLGYRSQVIHGHALVEFMVAEDQAMFRSRFKAFCNKPENKHIDVRFKYNGEQDGTTSFVGRIQGRRLDDYGQYDARGKRESLLVVISDVTELKLSEAKIAFQAYHDSLTGLPNRTRLHDRLDAALAQAARHHTYGALLFMDLDRFKNVNDSLGHHAGDQLLILFSERLNSQLRREDLLVRMGGDEFVVLLSEQHSDTNQAALRAQRLATHLLETLDDPLRIMGNQIQATVSIGIAVFPFQPNDLVGDVIRQADTAMYQAKSEGRNQIRFFHAELEQRARQRLTLESELRTALAQQQFEIFYQPQVSSHSGRIIGAEALLRWRHPQMGLLAPSEHIRIMEETGLIVAAGHWILEQVVAQVKQWQATGVCRNQLRVAVNISPSQLQIDQFNESVEKLLKAYDLNPGCLVFEITENLLLPDDSACRAVMRRLEALGITFSVDDFGTGYSSLFVLQNSSIGQLKIAQQFIRDLDPQVIEDEVSRHNVLALIRAIISMAKALNMGVVAEGIETENQRRLLADLGCDQMQGYLFARPLPAAEMTRLLEQQFEEDPPR